MTSESPDPTPVDGAPRGRTFDEFQVGDVIRSEARTIAQADIDAFAKLSGDFNPAHVDQAFAKASVFRGTIAHGMLVQSVASGLAYQTGVFDGTVVAFVELSIRFLSPVRPGQSLRLELAVAAKDPAPSPKRGWVRFEAKVFDDGGTLVVDGRWELLLTRRRPKAR
ncbi:MAG: MaoC family dehydratase N-terminal domain-containing protein [Planctomycetes bacterium]|nr:MaoC family dehydratase N-terminal domain-containing protein [Planctomycetota bacterium]